MSNGNVQAPLGELLIPPLGAANASLWQQHPASLLLLLVVLSLIPFLFLSATSFLKLSVVFNILRNALGAQGIPPAAVTGILAFVLTLQIMAPVAQHCFQEFQSAVALEERKVKTPGPDLALAEFSLAQLINITRATAEPLLSFLKKHSAERERTFFSAASPEKSEGIFSLFPAFVLSELAAAFLIGFTLFLPFLVVDLLVTNVLIALGMSMVNPVSITLPLKLGLFILADGWFLISRGLLAGYGIGPS